MQLSLLFLTITFMLSFSAKASDYYLALDCDASPHSKEMMLYVSKDNQKIKLIINGHQERQVVGFKLGAVSVVDYINNGILERVVFSDVEDRLYRFDTTVALFKKMTNLDCD